MKKATPIDLHEFRTHITIIKAFTELMKRDIARGKLDRINHYLSKIDEKVNLICALIP